MEYYAMIKSAQHRDAGVELPALKAEPLEESPEIASFGEKHRCKRFPCPICNPGRSQQILLQLIPDEVDSLPRRPDGHDEQAAPLHISLGDGGHKCKRFPCPVCQQGRRSASLQVQ